MPQFKDFIKNIGDNLASYSKSALQSFINEAQNEMSGLSEYYVLGDKDVSILKSNLDYIKSSVSTVNGTNAEATNSGRKAFHYYNSDGTWNASLERQNVKPLLANPNEDLGKASFKGLGWVKGVIAQNIVKNNPQKKVGATTVDELGEKEYTKNEFPTSNNRVYAEAEEGKNKIIEHYSTTTGEFTLSKNGDEYNSDPASLHSKTANWLDDVDAPKKIIKRSVSEEFAKSERELISSRFGTIISRFHTKNSASDIDELENSVENSSFSKQYGASHGRNLLRENHASTDNDSYGYRNPYCRVWTWHHQYSHYVKDTMRPFSTKTFETFNINNWDTFRNANVLDSNDAEARLRKHSALYNHGPKTIGLVKITPTKEDINTEQAFPLQHCMFSIENLAWKGMFNDFDDENILSKEQKGPLGGRIMWFPPYDLTMGETSSAKWDENTFIGRGEPMYTYSNTTRTGSIHFKLLIDHPAILDYWERRNLEQGGSPIGRDVGGVDDVKSKEQELLRFFAGCSILKARKPESGTTSNSQDVTPNAPSPTTPEPIADPEDEVLNFLVFFPNNYSGKDDGTGEEGVNPIEYLVNGVGAQLRYNYSGNTITTLATQLKQNYTYNGGTVGGYEMRTSPGVSIVTSRPSGDETNAITSITCGSDSYTLMKQYDSKTKKGTAVSTKGMSSAQIEEWRKGRWLYRVDNDTINQKLTNNDSYIDKTSYQLNSVNYTDGVSYYHLQDPTYSLTEVYIALAGDENNVLSGLYKDNDRIAYLKEIFRGTKGKITQIKCQGRASSQANNESANVNDSRNTTLARNRGLTIQKWLQSQSLLKNQNINYSTPIFNYDKTKDGEQHDANDKDAKLNRMALVEIHYSPIVTEDASKTKIVVTSDGTAENNSTTTNNLTQEESMAKSGQLFNSETFQDNGDGTAHAANSDLDNVEIVSSSRKERRYDNEAKFFDAMKEGDPFMYKLISDKIRFFNPAFHSMSPEGFNARLTFLNQCMRQGPTISGSDTSGRNANNLSFGRPPVCVLRIGDFYNTKIIVTNLDIRYDPLTWDLNQEGIGVMPMIADVTMSFNFIGGSELGGPVERLQNAISYNYYANTSVYDNRAEMIEYSHSKPGEVEHFLPFYGGSNIYYNDSEDTENTED